MFDHSKVKRNAAILLAKIQITFKFYCDIQILNILSLPRKNNKTVKLPLKQKTNLMVPCSTIKNWLKAKQIWLKTRQQIHMEIPIHAFFSLKAAQERQAKGHRN